MICSSRSAFANHVAFADRTYLRVNAQAKRRWETPGDQIYGVQENSTNSTATISANGAGGVGSNSYPSGENPGNAIDQTNAKYLNFAGTSANTAVGNSPGIIVTPAAGGSVLNGVQFQAGNDSPDRDPLTVAIYGSNTNPASGLVAGNTINTTGYTLLYSGVSGLAVDPGRDTFGALVTFANSTSYTTYEVLTTSARDPNQGCCIQYDEIGLTSGNVPEPASLGTLALAGFGWLARRRRA